MWEKLSPALGKPRKTGFEDGCVYTLEEERCIVELHAKLGNNWHFQFDSISFNFQSLFCGIQHLHYINTKYMQYLILTLYLEMVFLPFS